MKFVGIFFFKKKKKKRKERKEKEKKRKEKKRKEKKSSSSVLFPETKTARLRILVCMYVCMYVCDNCRHPPKLYKSQMVSHFSLNFSLSSVSTVEAASE